MITLTDSTINYLRAMIHYNSGSDLYEWEYATKLVGSDVWTALPKGRQYTDVADALHESIDEAGRMIEDEKGSLGVGVRYFPLTEDEWQQIVAIQTAEDAEKARSEKIFQDATASIEVVSHDASNSRFSSRTTIVLNCMGTQYTYTDWVEDISYGENRYGDFVGNKKLDPNPGVPEVTKAILTAINEVEQQRREKECVSNIQVTETDDALLVRFTIYIPSLKDSLKFAVRPKWHPDTKQWACPKTSATYVWLLSHKAGTKDQQAQWQELAR